MRPVLRTILGIVFILYGIVALITPLTPVSVLTIFIGFELVGLGFLIPEKARTPLAKWKEKVRNWFIRLWRRVRS